ncbi:MAG: ATP synthase subunit I [Thiomonas sp.]
MLSLRARKKLARHRLSPILSSFELHANCYPQQQPWRLLGVISLKALDPDCSLLRCVSTHRAVFNPGAPALNHTVQSTDPWQDQEDAPAAAPMTRAEVQSLLLRKPQVSVWRVVVLQVVVGLVVAVASWFFSAGQWPVVFSALYGAGIIALPSALFALSIQLWLSKLKPGVAVYGFALGELLKIGLTIVLLFFAPRVVQPLSWAAMLIAIVVTLQVYWVALILRGKKARCAT